MGVLRSPRAEGRNREEGRPLLLTSLLPWDVQLRKDRLQMIRSLGWDEINTEYRYTRGDNENNCNYHTEG
jgi:hypothetical protein